MGVPVSGFNEFRAKLSEVQGRSVIFGVLLYDSRPSQQIVNQFTQEQAPWIDDLARGAGIYFFFPFERESEDFKNPSVEIARIFRLGLARLPGIVLFVPPGEDGKVSSKHAVYIPLEEQDFNDIAIYEPIFIDLFDLIRDSIEKHKKSELVLRHVKDELAKLRSRKNRRGFARYIRKRAHLIMFDLPKALYVPIAKSFGRALGEKIVSP